MTIQHYTEYALGAMNDSTISAEELAETAVRHMGEDAVKAMVLAHGTLAQQTPSTLGQQT